MKKQMHMSRLMDLVRTAAFNEENLNEDGSINWDFVSADLHIDTDETSDRIEKAIGRVVRSITLQERECGVHE